MKGSPDTVISDHQISAIPESLRFPRTIQESSWIYYLGRNLNYTERNILSNVKTEYDMNQRLTEIYQILEEKNNKIISDDQNNYRYYVPELTNLDGNCLFESLVYHGLANSVNDIRQGMAYILFLFKDYQDLFPNFNMSLKEMYDMTNEIEYVRLSRYDKDGYRILTPDSEPKVYKYSYNVMCQDLTTGHSWSKLPTEILLRTLSLMFNLNITVFHNNGHQTNINAYADSTEQIPELTNIYLGHLGESHYIPIDTYDTDELLEQKQIFYSNDRKEFKKWALHIENIMITTYMTKQQRIRRDPQSINNHHDSHTD